MNFSATMRGSNAIAIAHAIDLACAMEAGKPVGTAWLTPTRSHPPLLRATLTLLIVTLAGTNAAGGAIAG